MLGRLAAFGAISVVFSAFPAAAWERLTTEEQFRASITDRTITTAEGNSFTSHSDGRVTGTWGGQPMSGRWEWHQGFWCRNVRVGDTESGTDCQTVERRGNEVRNTRNQGRGAPGVGRLN